MAVASLDINHTKETGAVRLQAWIMTQSRYFNVVAFGQLKDSFFFISVDFFAV
jgi:hypothetical protein